MSRRNPLYGRETDRDLRNGDSMGGGGGYQTSLFFFSLFFPLFSRPRVGLATV